MGQQMITHGILQGYTPNGSIMSSKEYAERSPSMTLRRGFIGSAIGLAIMALFSALIGNFFGGSTDGSYIERLPNTMAFMVLLYVIFMALVVKAHFKPFRAKLTWPEYSYWRANADLRKTAGVHIATKELRWLINAAEVADGEARPQYAVDSATRRLVELSKHAGMDRQDLLAQVSQQLARSSADTGPNNKEQSVTDGV